MGVRVSGVAFHWGFADDSRCLVYHRDHYGTDLLGYHDVVSEKHLFVCHNRAIESDVGTGPGVTGCVHHVTGHLVVQPSRWHLASTRETQRHCSRRHSHLATAAMRWSIDREEHLERPEAAGVAIELGHPPLSGPRSEASEQVLAVEAGMQQVDLEVHLQDFGSEHHYSIQQIKPPMGLQPAR